MLLFTKYKCTWLTAISMSLSRCIACQDVYVQQSHATKGLLPQYIVNLCGFVVTVSLRSKDQQQNNPLATFTTASAGKGRDMSELQTHHCMTL